MRCVGSRSLRSIRFGKWRTHDQGDGVYELTDATFGEYGCARDDSPAEGVTFIGVCDKVSFGGKDQYDLVYSFSIVGNTGAALIMSWQNDFGDSGVTKLTRTDGKLWPATLHH